MEFIDDYLSSVLSEKKIASLAQISENMVHEMTRLSLKVDTTEISVGNLGDFCPKLRSLRLSHSTLNSVRDFGSSLRNLERLWLDNCNIMDITGLSNCFPNLTELHLNNNLLYDISDLMYLEKLEILDLSHNSIDSVRQIEFLKDLQYLVHLNILNNPIMDKDGGSNKIGFDLLPHLEVFNNEKIFFNIMNSPNTKKKKIIDPPMAVMAPPEGANPRRRTFKRRIRSSNDALEKDSNNSSTDFNTKSEIQTTMSSSTFDSTTFSEDRPNSSPMLDFDTHTHQNDSNSVQFICGSAGRSLRRLRRKRNVEKDPISKIHKRILEK
ncbi:hypothetical protein PCE1_002985 [Barthelona sp. PCE]